MPAGPPPQTNTSTRRAFVAFPPRLPLRRRSLTSADSAAEAAPAKPAARTPAPRRNRRRVKSPRAPLFRIVVDDLRRVVRDSCSMFIGFPCRERNGRSQLSSNQWSVRTILSGMRWAKPLCPPPMAMFSGAGPYRCGTIAIRQYRRRALPRQRRPGTGDRASPWNSAFASVAVPETSMYDARNVSSSIASEERDLHATHLNHQPVDHAIDGHRRRPCRPSCDRSVSGRLARRGAGGPGDSSRRRPLPNQLPAGIRCQVQTAGRDRGPGDRRRVAIRAGRLERTGDGRANVGLAAWKRARGGFRTEAGRPPIAYRRCPTAAGRGHLVRRLRLRPVGSPIGDRAPPRRSLGNCARISCGLRPSTRKSGAGTR